MNPFLAGRTILCLVLVLIGLLLAASPRALAEGESRRLSTPQIVAYLNTIEQWQARLTKLQANPQTDEYQASKAGYWLSFSRTKLEDNDHGPVLNATFAQATNIISRLESAPASLTRDMPEFPFAPRIREDLWKLADEFKKHTNFAAGQVQVARMEVYLIWASYEYRTVGWRRAAKPTLEKAEDAAVIAAKAIGCQSPIQTPVIALEMADTNGPAALNLDLLQKTLRELNTRGVPIRSYAFAKAQHWLDFAQAQEASKDRTGVIPHAAAQAALIIRQIKAGDPTAGQQTPLFKTMKKIRPDLGDVVEEAKKHPAFASVADLVAQLEVQLAWAAHEFGQLGWRTARPHVTGAERFSEEILETLNAASRNGLVPPK